MKTIGGGAPRTQASLWVQFLSFIPPANEVWGKVMFLHLSVSYSVHGGWGCDERVVKGVCGERGVSRGCVSRGCVPEGVSRGVLSRVCVVDTPRTQRLTTPPPHREEMATEAGGTHPTGMPSCHAFFSEKNNQIDLDRIGWHIHLWSWTPPPPGKYTSPLLKLRSVSSNHSNWTCPFNLQLNEYCRYFPLHCTKSPSFT